MAVLSLTPQFTAVSTSNGTTISTAGALPSTIPVGSCVFVLLATNSTGTATATCADNSANAGAANVYTLDDSEDSTTQNLRLFLWRSNVTRSITNAGSHVFTATLSASTNLKAMVVFSVAGWTVTPAVDKTATKEGTTSSMSVGPTTATAFADEFVLAAYAAAVTVSSPTYTDTAGYTVGQKTTANATGRPTAVYSWKESSSTGVQSHSATLSNMTAWVGVMKTYRATVGGTVYTQSLSGSVGFSGSMVRLPQKQHAASLTTVGVLSRAVTGRRFTGALLMSGGLRRETARLLAAGFAPSGAFPQGLSHSMTASFTPVGGFGPVVTGKQLAGVFAASGRLLAGPGYLRSVFTPTGTLNKATTKATPMTGAVTFVGAHSRMFNYSQALSGAITFSGAITRRASTRTLTAVFAPAGVLMRAFSLLGTLGGAVFRPSGVLTKETQRSLPGASVGFSGVLSRETQRTLGVTLALSGSVATGFGKALFASLRASGSLSSLYVPGVVVLPLTVESDTPSGPGGGGLGMVMSDSFFQRYASGYKPTLRKQKP